MRQNRSNDGKVIDLFKAIARACLLLEGEGDVVILPLLLQKIQLCISTRMVGNFCCGISVPRPQVDMLAMQGQTQSLCARSIIVWQYAVG